MGTNKRCQNWAKQEPSCRQDDIKRREYKLSIIALNDLIEMLYFMELESVYGNSKENQCTIPMCYPLYLILRKKR